VISEWLLAYSRRIKSNNKSWKTNLKVTLSTFE
jgi:hypothetical protein